MEASHRIEKPGKSLEILYCVFPGREFQGGKGNFGKSCNDFFFVNSAQYRFLKKKVDVTHALGHEVKKPVE